MSYPVCPHGYSDPMFNCPQCEADEALANARTDLASCQSDLRERDEQLRLARMALARAAELLSDSAKPFDEARTIIRAQLPNL